MKSLKGKKILILGGTAPCVHVTRFAKEMGAYVYVADEQTKQLSSVPMIMKHCWLLLGSIILMGF